MQRLCFFSPEQTISILNELFNSTSNVWQRKVWPMETNESSKSSEVALKEPINCSLEAFIQNLRYVPLEVQHDIMDRIEKLKRDEKDEGIGLRRKYNLGTSKL